MGKRKSRKAPPKPKRKLSGPLPTSFDCPFCNHEKVVECKLDRDKSIGVVRCSVCDASYQMIINTLSEPIDVYSEWLDQCQAENESLQVPDDD